MDVLAILMVVYVFRHVLNRAMASDAVTDTDSTMVTVVAQDDKDVSRKTMHAAYSSYLYVG